MHNQHKQTTTGASTSERARTSAHPRLCSTAVRARGTSPVQPCPIWTASRSAWARTQCRVIPRTVPGVSADARAAPAQRQAAPHAPVPTAHAHLAVQRHRLIQVRRLLCDILVVVEPSTHIPLYNGGLSDPPCAATTPPRTVSNAPHAARTARRGAGDTHAAAHRHTTRTHRRGRRDRQAARAGTFPQQDNFGPQRHPLVCRNGASPCVAHAPPQRVPRPSACAGCCLRHAAGVAACRRSPVSRLRSRRR